MIKYPVRIEKERLSRGGSDNTLKKNRQKMSRLLTTILLVSLLTCIPFLSIFCRASKHFFTGMVIFSCVAYLATFLYRLLSLRVLLTLEKPPSKDEIEQRFFKEKDILPPVSILKPLYGVPEALRENLESYFQLQYPNLELVFCTQTEQDGATKLVRELLEKYPEANAWIKVGFPNHGICPRVNNLAGGYEKMEHDLFFIYDANIIASDAALLAAVDMCTKDSTLGMVHQLPAMLRENNSELHRMYFSTTHCTQYLFMDALHRMFWNSLNSTPCVCGMGSMMRKSALEKVGGIKNFAKYMAEDCEYAVHLQNIGYKVLLSPHTATQRLGKKELSDEALRVRLTRWCRIRYNQPSAHSYAFEWMIETCWFSTYLVICLSLCYNCTYSGALTIGLIHMTLIALYDYFTNACVDQATDLTHAKTPIRESVFVFLRFWLKKELLLIRITVNAWADFRHVQWGKTVYKLRDGMEGVDAPVEASSPSSGRKEQ